MPTYQGVRLENGECLQTAGPDPVEPDPEQAFAPAETQLAVFAVGTHQFEVRAVLEKLDQLIFFKKDFVVGFHVHGEEFDQGEGKAVQHLF